MAYTCGWAAFIIGATGMETIFLFLLSSCMLKARAPLQPICFRRSHGWLKIDIAEFCSLSNGHERLGK